MENKIKLPFAIKNGELISIFDVESGKQKDCFCPCCGSVVIARIGNKNVPHFAHSSACNFGLQTALHLKAKEILSNSKSIFLPALFARDYQLHDALEIELSEVYLEKKTGNIVPDIIVVSKGRKLFIEIAVTHFSNVRKIIEMEKLGIGGIEIDLSAYFTDSSEYTKTFFTETLPSLIINNINCKRWLFSPKREFFYKEMKSISHKKQSIWIKGSDFNYVDDCPLNKRIWKSGYKEGKSYANSEYDCPKCPNLFTIENKQKDMGAGISYSQPFPEYVYCMGNKEKEFDAFLKKWKVK